MSDSPQEEDRIRLGVVGLRFGRWVLELDLLAGGARHVEVVAVCDADPDARAEVAHLGLPAHTDLDELLADESIEAVALFTGPNGRADLIHRVFDAGRHVMTTKPFERDANAAAEVLVEAGRLGLVLHANSPAVITPPDLAQIQRWRDDHDLGRPVSARWDTSCSYHEEANDSWYDDPDRCPLAPVFRIGVYGLNELCTLLGSPDSVQARSSRIRTGRPTADNATAVLHYADGALATVSASFCVDDGLDYHDELSVSFERGSVHRRAVTVDGVRHSEVTLRTRSDQAEATVLFPRVQSATFEWGRFRRAIREPGSRPLTVPVDTTVAGVRVLEALARAERSGAIESV